MKAGPSGMHEASPGPPMAGMPGTAVAASATGT